MILEPKGKSAMFIMLDFLIGTHFFKKNIKKFFAFHAGEGSKNYFFTLDESEPLIFFMFLPHLITRFVLKETEKKAWGGKLFSFFKGPKSLCPKFGIWNRGAPPWGFLAPSLINK